MVRVIRATVLEAPDVYLLLDDYYREIEVVQRDSPEAVDRLPRRSEFRFLDRLCEWRPCRLRGVASARAVSVRGECKRLYVRAQFRRKGIAEALLDAMEHYASQSSLACIYLDSKDDLRAAIALYRRRGYQSCERYNDDPQATIFLRKSLSSGR